MNLIFRFKFLTCVVGLFFIFSSCNDLKYIVYNEDFKKVKIDLSDTNNIVVLNSFVSCIDCLSGIMEYFSKKKKVIFVNLISSKNKYSVISVKRDLDKYTLQNSELFFQFSKKNDSYHFHRKNRIFKDYDRFQAPLVIMHDKNNQFKTLTPPEFELFSRDSIY